MAEGKKGGGCLKILGCGCLVLFLMVVVAAGVGYFKIVKPMMDSVRETEQIQKQAMEAQAALAEQDGALSYSAPEDLSQVVLTGSDVDRYVAVREGLADAAGGYAKAQEEFAATFDFSKFSQGQPGFGEMMNLAFGAFDRVKGMMRARLELLQQAQAVLQAENMTTAELEDLVGIIDWRFLGREDLIYMGLASDQERQEYRSKRQKVRFLEGILSLTEGQGGANEAKMDEMREELKQASAWLEEKAAQARDNRSLAPETRRLLEPRRAELEALPEDGIGVLTGLTDPQADPLEQMPGMFAPGM